MLGFQPCPAAVSLKPQPFLFLGCPTVLRVYTGHWHPDLPLPLWGSQCLTCPACSVAVSLSVLLLHSGARTFLFWTVELPARVYSQIKFLCRCSDTPELRRWAVPHRAHRPQFMSPQLALPEWVGSAPGLEDPLLQPVTGTPL